MKGLLTCFTVMLLLVYAVTASAQQCPSNKYQWDFSGSYGLMAAGKAEGKEITNTPAAAFFSIKYFIYNRLAVGACGGISTEKSKQADPYNASIANIYSVDGRTVAVELYYIYLFRKYLEVFTFAGAGPGFKSSTITNITGSFSSTVTTNSDGLRAQYTPIAIRVGGRIGGYAELGYGYKGILNLGLSVKLGPSSWWKGEFR
jgi:hypothetical protein